MHTRRFCAFLLFALMLSLLSVSANAQTNMGTPEYGSLFPINAYEEINLASLGIVVHAPIRSKGGPIPLAYALTENAQIFTNGAYQYDTTAGKVSLATGALAGGFSTGFDHLQTCVVNGQQITTSIINVYGTTDGYGTLHPFRNVIQKDTNACWFTSTDDVFTDDNAGLEAIIPPAAVNGRVYDKNGMSTLADTHGNAIAVSFGPGNTIKYIDPLTSTPVLQYDTSQQPPGTSLSYSYYDAQNTLRSVTANYTSGLLLPTFSCPPPMDPRPIRPYIPSLPSRIQTGVPSH